MLSYSLLVMTCCNNGKTHISWLCIDLIENRALSSRNKTQNMYCMSLELELRLKLKLKLKLELHVLTNFFWEYWLYFDLRKWQRLNSCHHVVLVVRINQFVVAPLVLCHSKVFLPFQFLSSKLAWYDVICPLVCCGCRWCCCCLFVCYNYKC